MPALVNDLAVGVAVPEAGGVMSVAPMLAVCDELSRGVVSGTVGSNGVKFGCYLAWRKVSYMIERQLK